MLEECRNEKIKFSDGEMTRGPRTSTTECQGMRSSISTCADRLMETRNNIKASRCRQQVRLA
eukprot:15032393-Heterocapsa_arctica.AAC.1